MKNLIILLMLVMTAGGAKAQGKTEKTIIKTSAECDMCKERIEKALVFSKGVKSANLDLNTKEVTVEFNPKKTDKAAIKEIIRNTGYDADGDPANNKAYDKLPECCKKGAHSK